MARVLLIEDDSSLAAGLAAALTHDGFVVDVVDRGRLAVGLVAHTHPDAVVIDVGLADVDGLVVAQALRRAWPKLAIILMTGHDITAARLIDAAKMVNAVTLQKPFDVDELEAVIGRVTRM